MLVSLDSGAGDIITTDKPYAIAAMKVHPKFVMLDFSGNPDDDFKVEPEDIDLGISVQKGNQELLDQFNEFLAGISEDERHRMLDEAASVQPINVGDGNGQTSQSCIHQRKKPTFRFYLAVLLARATALLKLLGRQATHFRRSRA